MEQEEFIRLITQHSGIIHKILYLYVDDPEDKVDLKQEILVQAWTAIGRFKQESTFSTWLYRVALNTVLTFQRKAERLPTSGTSDELINIPSSNTQKHPQSENLFRVIK
ncbi:MAG: RNA polymerase sigma factor, partial [Ekhidna sp.]